MRRSFVVAALLLASPGAGVAQSPPAHLDPVATVESFWRAVLAMRWVEAVSFLDQSDLEWARRMQLESAQIRPGRDYTVADLMLRDPDMPREAAEYEIRRRDKLRQQYPERPFRNYDGVDSAAQLERMPLEEVGVRWLQAHDPLWFMLEQHRRSQCPPSAWADSALAGRRATVYGAVPAGADTAYVVFKADWFPGAVAGETPELWMPKIAVLRRGASGWRIRALEDLVQGVGGLFGVGNCRDSMKRPRD